MSYKSRAFQVPISISFGGGLSGALHPSRAGLSGRRLVVRHSHRPRRLGPVRQRQRAFCRSGNYETREALRCRAQRRPCGPLRLAFRLALLYMRAAARFSALVMAASPAVRAGIYARTDGDQIPRIFHGSLRHVCVSFCRILPRRTSADQRKACIY